MLAFTILLVINGIISGALDVRLKQCDLKRRKTKKLLQQIQVLPFLDSNNKISPTCNIKQYSTVTSV